MKKYNSSILKAILFASIFTTNINANSIDTLAAPDCPTPSFSASFDNRDEHYSFISRISEGDMNSITNVTKDNRDIISRNGKSGNCIYLDGSYGLDLDFSLNTNYYSVSFWIKPDEITGGTPTLSIFNGDFVDTNTFMSILLDYDFYQPNIFSHSAINNEDKTYSSGAIGYLHSNIWTHIIVSVAPSSETTSKYSLYIDGKYICENEIASGFLNDNSNCWFGINLYNEMYKGYVDEINVYNHALTIEEATSLYDSYQSRNNEPNNERPGGNHGNGGSHGGSQTIFDSTLDDIISVDQGSLPNNGNSSLNPALNPGLAAGIQYKTDSYADTAMLLGILLLCLSICLILTYKKKKHNHY